MGGVARRATVIKNYRATHPNVLPVCGGGWAQGSSAESQKVQSLFLMDAMGTMGYSVVNVAPSDLSWGVEVLRQTALKNKIDLVASNLKSKADGKYIFNPYVIRNVKGICVAFLGVMQEGEPMAPYTTNTADSDNLQIIDAKEAVGALLPEVRAKADVIVCFTHIGQRKTQQLADEQKGIDVAISGMDGFVNYKATEVGTDSTTGKTIVLEAGERGKYLGAFSMVVSEHGKILRYTNEVHALDKNVKDDSLMSLQVNDLKDRLKEIHKREALEGAVGGGAGVAAGSGPQEKFIGSLVCARCHQAAYDSWKDSKHAHAMAALEAKAMEGSAECLKCHVTGYNEPSGYPTGQEMGSVSCEQCHGYGTLHGDSKFQVKPAAATCTACHDQKNSPNFDYKSYWSKMAH